MFLICGCWIAGLPSASRVFVSEATVMAIALLGLGSNLGDRGAILAAAMAAFGNSPGIRVVAASAWHETKAIGGPAGQGAFLNGAALLETSLSPIELLARLQRIESHLGRRRDERWAARTLDLDLLLYDNLVLETPLVVLPHPRMAFRRFVLAPAVEVAPEMVHPLLGWTVRRLWDHLNKALPYVAIGRFPGINAVQLGQEISLQMPARLICDTELASANACDAEAAEQRALSNLNRWRGLLTSSEWPQSPPLTISDFWLDEILCLADAGLTTSQQEHIEEVWWDLRPSVTPPKLVLCSEAAHAVVRHFTSDLGPWLRLREGEAESNRMEAIAAIQSMQ